MASVKISASVQSAHFGQTFLVQRKRSGLRQDGVASTIKYLNVYFSIFRDAGLEELVDRFGDFGSVRCGIGYGHGR